MVGENDVNSDHDCDMSETTITGVVSEEIQTKPNLDSSTNVIHTHNASINNVPVGIAQVEVESKLKSNSHSIFLSHR